MARSSATNIRLGVDKSASHHLSQTEIGSDNPCSRHLSYESTQLVLSALDYFGLARNSPKTRLPTDSKPLAMVWTSFPGDRTGETDSNAGLAKHSNRSCLNTSCSAPLSERPADRK